MLTVPEVRPDEWHVHPLDQFCVRRGRRCALLAIADTSGTTKPDWVELHDQKLADAQAACQALRFREPAERVIRAVLVAMEEGRPLTIDDVDRLKAVLATLDL